MEPQAQLAAPVAVVPYWSYWVVPLTLGFFGLVQALGMRYLAGKFGEVKTELVAGVAAAASSAANTAVSVESVHKAVNSERTAAVDEIRKLRDELLKITSDNVRLVEQAAAKELAKSTEKLLELNKQIKEKEKS